MRALTQRIDMYIKEQGWPSYIVNLDPAVKHVGFTPNIDIRDTVDYKEVMSEYKLGPNGAIMTSLNLFATRFEQVVAIGTWKAEAYRAQEQGVPMHIAIASAGIDFNEDAMGVAAASPWASTTLAVWQWSERVPDTDPHACLVAGLELRYALRSAPCRLFRSKCISM